MRCVMASAISRKPAASPRQPIQSAMRAILPQAYTNAQLSQTLTPCSPPIFERASFQSP